MQCLLQQAATHLNLFFFFFLGCAEMNNELKAEHEKE